MRPVLFEGADGFRPTPVYEGAACAEGDAVTGPAIVEETNTTIAVPRRPRSAFGEPRTSSSYLLG